MPTSFNELNKLYELGTHSIFLCTGLYRIELVCFILFYFSVGRRPAQRAQ